MTHRVAILGAGIGREHVAGYLDLPEAFQVVTICDLDAAKAGALAGVAGAGVASDIDAVLNDVRVDIVDICLPPSMHSPTAARALQAGKHVICEKPLAASPAEAHRLVAIEQATGKRVFPVFQYRFGRGFYQLQALADAGMLGKPRVGTLETHWNRGADYYAVPWRGTKSYEIGGAVMSHAIHIHDLISLTFGPVTEVSARLDTLINPIETEDCGAILMGFECGALVTSSLTLGGADNMSRLRLVYEHLTAESGTNPYAPGQSDWRFLARDATKQAQVDALVASVPNRRQGFAGLFEAVARALDGRTTQAPKLADGIASIELAAAIYGSNSSKTAVSLPLSPDFPEFAGQV